MDRWRVLCSSISFHWDDFRGVKLFTVHTAAATTASTTSGRITPEVSYRTVRETSKSRKYTELWKFPTLFGMAQFYWSWTRWLCSTITGWGCQAYYGLNRTGADRDPASFGAGIFHGPPSPAEGMHQIAPDQCQHLTMKNSTNKFRITRLKRQKMRGAKEKLVTVQNTNRSVQPRNRICTKSGRKI